MDRRMGEALDRHITGNYGADQFACHHPEGEPICQVANCEEDAEDGVLCIAHQPGRCPVCHTDQSLNDNGTLRRHRGGDALDLATDGVCSGSGGLPS